MTFKKYVCNFNNRNKPQNLIIFTLEFSLIIKLYFTFEMYRRVVINTSTWFLDVYSRMCYENYSLYSKTE